MGSYGVDVLRLSSLHGFVLWGYLSSLRGFGEQRDAIILLNGPEKQDDVLN